MKTNLFDSFLYEKDGSVKVTAKNVSRWVGSVKTYNDKKNAAMMVRRTECDVPKNMPCTCGDITPDRMRCALVDPKSTDGGEYQGQQQETVL